MVEVKNISKGVSLMNARLVRVKTEMDKERRQGLDADWVAVAEDLEWIRETVDHLIAAAWRVQYETVLVSDDG